ncbi:MAG: ATP-grasp domain-containing protein [Aureispira sp.]|nr:ATP-grasp domain-containing protein [Aureispira sp.]
MSDSKSTTTIKSILIANRGEIAIRVIRTCRRLGIRSIAVYSDADKHMPFVTIADEAIALGGLQSSESYLDVDKIIAAAKRSEANAIHPGYGFLSENSDFARRCAEENIIFIGPNPEAIDAMGLKSRAKTIMEENGVPVINGYQGINQTVDHLVNKAKEVGYPVLVKAVAGGGGKGMRIAMNEREIKSAIGAAKREAKSSFGNGRLIIERYFPSSRHIEFQIFGDKHGNVFHLLERECTIQRRYQKIVEESPSSALTPELRAEMAEAAIKAAKAINYDNAGTVEFILNEKGEFFFLEVNTRLQVEHPVTEAITWLDLVELQILVAEGKPLPLQQQFIEANGYAMECRLYAEDPLKDFFPATGKVLHWEPKQLMGLRYDSGIKTGTDVGIYYDPMLAKIIAHGADREEAIRRMIYALKQLKCLGLTTNQGFLINLLQNEDVLAGNYNTKFLDDKFDFEQLAIQHKEGLELANIATLVYRWHQREQQRKLVTNLKAGWRSNFYQMQQEQYLVAEEAWTTHYNYLGNHKFEVKLNEKEFEVELVELNNKLIRINVNGQLHNFTLAQNNEHYYLHHIKYGQLVIEVAPRFPEIELEAVKGGYQAPMPGEILKVLVKAGDKVKEGASLITLLSMKMENTIAAHEDGVIEEIYVTAGENVESGVLLLKMEKKDA